MAGAESGFVVFQRDNKESDESDIWDDTALVKAYDNAVSIMKTRLAARDGNDDHDDNKTEESASQSAQPPAQDGEIKKKRKKHRSKKKKHKHWNVGDQCRAVFTEDGLLYDAEIIALDLENKTCTVRYADYHNEEDHALSDLLLPASQTVPQVTNVSISETDSNEVTMQSPSVHRCGRGRSAAAAEHAPRWQPGTDPYYPFFQGMHHRVPPVPPPPPPPPPPVTDDMVGDDEALSSMLIAWYMSGYHTGYYQGLKQGRSQSGGGAAR